MSKPLAIGLRSASSEDIAKLKKQYPHGKHKTHYITGGKMPHNGIFLIKGDKNG